MTDQNTWQTGEELPKRKADYSRMDVIGQNGNDGEHYGAKVMQAHEFLESGLGHMKDRASTYDKPEGERSMGKCVDMFRALTGLQMTEEQGWKFMCCLKLARSEQGGFRADNFEDLCAYGGLAGEAASNAQSGQKNA